MFKQPTRAIYTPEDLVHFHNSLTYKQLLHFISILNDAAKGKRRSEYPACTDISTKIIIMLETLAGWVAEIPPIQQPMRFGNKAFRQWHQRLVERSTELVKGLLPFDLSPATVELVMYLHDSFGNPTRIDYGTGHETIFIMFLCALSKLELIKPSDAQSVVLHVFPKYLQVCRLLQGVYFLEPAGSHGVWSLDDYQILCFLFGSSQFVGSDGGGQDALSSPEVIHKESLVTEYEEDYMYFAAINFIKKMKKGSHFGEHSPILNDISGLPSWKKVNGGLMKMYAAEVLGKLPVIQHFVFGTLLPAQWIPSRAAPDESAVPKGFELAGPSLPKPPVADTDGTHTKAPWAK